MEDRRWVEVFIKKRGVWKEESGGIGCEGWGVGEG